MSSIELPVLYRAAVRYHTRRNELLWLVDFQSFEIKEARETQLVGRMRVPQYDSAIEWRMVDGMIMRPVSYFFVPFTFNIREYLDVLGPDDDVGYEPFVDHPCFVHVLTRSWPEAVVSLETLSELETDPDFKRIDAIDLDVRVKAIQHRLSRCRLIDGVIHREANLPSWVVPFHKDDVSLSLSPMDAASPPLTFGYHFNFNHRKAAESFAHHLAKGRDFESERSSFVPTTDPPNNASDYATAFCVAKILRQELAGRASWRISPYMSFVFAFMRQAFEKPQEFDLSDALLMLEQCKDEDMNTPMLRRVVARVKLRRQLIERYHPPVDQDVLAQEG